MYMYMYTLVLIGNLIPLIEQINVHEVLSVQGSLVVTYLILLSQ